jgi:nucleoside-diphosphate-sugar epimerase
MKPRVAIVGANGFIGGRTAEMLHLTGLAEVYPVVRSPVSFARLSRFDLPCRLADAFDKNTLAAAFKGCETVVHAVAGDRRTIVESVTPTYRAAERAGARRLIYLSSAAVHGQAPDPGTDEASPLNDRQPIRYNNAKVQAEHRLLKLRERGSVELVILRPGIVTGPRSSWTAGFASDLLNGEAYLVNSGKGICNSIYIDNLVHAIHLASTSPMADGHAFLVGDDETVSWADLYAPIAAAFGFDIGEVPCVEYRPPCTSWHERVAQLLGVRPVKAALSCFPMRWRRAATAALSILSEPDPRSPRAIDERLHDRGQTPIPTLEIALLHRCLYRLPHTKAGLILHYHPIVSFSEGCRRSIAWLAFAGYPVRPEYELPAPRGHVSLDETP